MLMGAAAFTAMKRFHCSGVVSQANWPPISGLDRSLANAGVVHQRIDLSIPDESGAGDMGKAVRVGQIDDGCMGSSLQSEVPD